MSSIPPVLPGGQQKKRNSTIIIAVATITAMVLGTVFLWPAAPSTGSIPGIFRSTDVQTGENPMDAPLSHEVLSPAVNPELQFQERFRADQAEAAELYDNPELRRVDYASPAQTQSAELEAYDNPELRRVDYANPAQTQSAELEAYDNPELRRVDYASPAQTQSAELEASDTNVWWYEFPEYAAP